MKRTLRDINVNGKKVLVRVDYNVPLTVDLRIANDKRIVATVPTIQYLLKRNAAVILMSHLGRPMGKVIPEMTLRPVSVRLSELLGVPVKFIDGDCVSCKSKKIVSLLNPGEIVLLENLRFHPEEEGKNSFGEEDKILMDGFARELASMGEVFVQDAFGAVHRSHASTVGIAKYIKNVAVGLLVEKELEFLGKSLKNPARPFLAILGGAKVSDKMVVIDNLLNSVDIVIIGGAMAYTFLKFRGISTGASLVEYDKIGLLDKFFKKAEEKNVDFILPIDHVIVNGTNFVGREMLEDVEVKVTENEVIPDGFIGVDIGPKSVEKFSKLIKSAKTVFWNGPLGIFEVDEFSRGTVEIAKLVANVTSDGAVSVIGGGDSIAAAEKAGVDRKISHISTGGGASLEFLEGKELPGIVAVPDK
jgi:phosphoglycerate kinase